MLVEPRIVLFLYYSEFLLAEAMCYLGLVCPCVGGVITYLVTCIVAVCLIVLLGLWCIGL
jgi:hypothetical protein